MTQKKKKIIQRGKTEGKIQMKSASEPCMRPLIIPMYVKWEPQMERKGAEKNTCRNNG